MSTPKQSAARVSITSFHSALHLSYGKHLQLSNPPWLHDMNTRSAVVASARIAHGREMIYIVSEPFRELSQRDEPQELQKKMIQCGVRSIMQAAEGWGDGEGVLDTILSALASVDN
jgi:hypothetical protein